MVHHRGKRIGQEDRIERDGASVETMDGNTVAELYDYVTSLFSLLSSLVAIRWLAIRSLVIGLDEESAKQIVYVVACIVAACMDPFFLYIPFLSRTKMCLGMNRELWTVALALRTIADFFTALILFMDRRQLSRCMSSIKSILLMCVKYLVLAPIPQILFSAKFILKTLGGYTFWDLILPSYYGARLVLIYQSCEKLKRSVSDTTLGRFNAPVYLVLYLIVSHMIGASWYYLSIKRQLSCWNKACKIENGCIFHCSGTTTSTLNSTIVNESCLINPPNATVFDYGIYLDALQSGIVEEEGVLKKFLRCFLWGLRNLSSFASNLQTSTNDGETIFVIIISAVALILFIYIIGDIQRYSALESARSERIVDKMKPIKKNIKCLGEMHKLSKNREKLIVEHIQKALENGTNKLGKYESFNLESFPDDGTNKESLKECTMQDLKILETSILDPEGAAEKWLSDNNIPHPRRNNILFYMNCKLLNNQDVNLKSVLSVLPRETENMIKRIICFDTLKQVPELQNMSDHLLESISLKLKPVIYPMGSCIIKVGDPLCFIIITNGIAWSYQTNEPENPEKVHLFGAELIQWHLDGTGECPTSRALIMSQTQVEAFVLMIRDLVVPRDTF